MITGYASSVDRLAWRDQGVALPGTSMKPGRPRHADRRNLERVAVDGASDGRANDAQLA